MYIYVHTHRRCNVAITKIQIASTTPKAGPWTCNVYASIYVYVHTHRRGNVAIPEIQIASTTPKVGLSTCNSNASKYIYICVHTQTWQYSHHRDSDREYHTKGGTVDV